MALKNGQRAAGQLRAYPESLLLLALAAVLALAIIVTTQGTAAAVPGLVCVLGVAVLAILALAQLFVTREKAPSAGKAG